MAEHLQPVRTRVVGLPSEVANVLRAAAARGHLVEYGTPCPVYNDRVAIDVTLLRPAPARRPVRPAQRPVQRRTVRIGGYVKATAVVVATALLGVLGYVLWVTVAWVIAWVSAHLATVIGTGVLLTAAGAYALVKSGSVCGGMHCPGCGH